YRHLVELPRTDTLERLLGELANVDAVVTSRLHGVILAHIVGKPTIAISFADKVDAYLDEIGQHRFRLSFHSFTTAKLIEQFTELVARREEITQHLSRTRDEFRDRLEGQFREILRNTHCRV